MRQITICQTKTTSKINTFASLPTTRNKHNVAILPTIPTEGTKNFFIRLSRLVQDHAEHKSVGKWARRKISSLILATSHHWMSLRWVERWGRHWRGAILYGWHLSRLFKGCFCSAVAIVRSRHTQTPNLLNPTAAHSWQRSWENVLRSW